MTVPSHWIISAAIIGGTFGVMSIAETVRPLRSRVENRVRRAVRNLTTGGVSLAVITILQAPVLAPVARWAEARRFGLLRLIALPGWLELLLAIVLLDYTLWWWHRGNHQLPFLWRFHLPHHVDLDLDASTALRFHFAELTLSIGYRTAQIVAIGVTPYTLWVWQTTLFVSILFHHSNLRLPTAIERALVPFVVTPRMHGIHHSDVRSETNSNWASLLTCWDYMHGTIRLDVEQDSIRVGVRTYDDRADVTIGKILAMPFRTQRDDCGRISA